MQTDMHAFIHGRRCVEGRVREGDVSPAQCEKLLQRLSYEWPDWDSRIRAGLGGRRAGVYFASRKYSSTVVDAAQHLKVPPFIRRRVEL